MPTGHIATKAHATVVAVWWVFEVSQTMERSSRRNRMLTPDAWSSSMDSHSHTESTVRETDGTRQKARTTDHGSPCMASRR